jgi:hypothetical protein
MPYSLNDLRPSSAALAARNARLRQAAIEREAREASARRFLSIAFGA